MNKFTKLLSKILAIVMIINLIPFHISMASLAEDQDIGIKLLSYKDGDIKKTIEQGEKGVDYNVNALYIEYDKSFKIDKNFKKPIKIIVNGKTEDFINSGNDKLKFDFQYDEDKKFIKIGIKEGQSNTTHMKPFILRKHSLYNVQIPEGFFINTKGEKSQEINYTFTTKGDKGYINDIIKEISPSTFSTGIDYKNGEITVDFIDDIYLDKYVLENKGKYFEIMSSAMTSPEVHKFNTFKKENIDDFNIKIDSNKKDRLIIKSKRGKLNDFAMYYLVLKDGAVQLKNTRNLTNGRIISNGLQTIIFATNDWIDSVNLNTGNWISYKDLSKNIKDVPINPLIQIKFKYPVDIVDKSKIKFTSDGDSFAIDVDKDSWINYDGDTLKLDINSLHRTGKYSLREDTAYKITLEKGALKLKGYNDSNTKSQIENDEINIYFITGDWKTKADLGLYVTGYSSDKQKTDDITNITNTRLDKDGSIYIHFNRPIQWNRWDKSIPVKNDDEALKYFKLYKSPRAYARDHDGKGVVFDKEFRYDQNRNNYTKDGANLDEIPIEYVKILKDSNGENTSVLEIKPKYELINLNRYIIQLTNKNIITDYYEKTLRYNINQSIWTKAATDTNTPKWVLPENITAEEIIENTNTPYKSYKIYGTPNYNGLIDMADEKPIVMYIDREVIPNPKILNPLIGIGIYEGYDIWKNIGFKWYKLEYFYQDGIKKTKLSLYPDQVLDSGKYYGIEIKENVFVTRGGRGLEGVELTFVVEGEKVHGKGIYNVDNISTPLLTSNFPSINNPIKISIKGYNFTENISKIRFVRRIDGKTITLPSTYVKFINVTDLEAEIKGDAAEEFAKRYSGGTYDVYVDFADGTVASPTSSGAKFVVKERPWILRTIPEDREDYFNEESLYESFPNDEKGYYLRVVFYDIDNKLKLIKTDTSGFRLYVEGDIGNNLIDNSKNLKTKSNGEELTVYIPIKEGLKPNQKYIVSIPENIVKFTDVNIEGNKAYEWFFSTSYTPKVDKLFDGSVPEYYDERYPIVLQGDMFNHNTHVYFKDTSGEYYDADDVKYRYGDTLEVYLPRRRDRLPVGLYDIIVSNDRDHETEYVYGVLSVVKDGDYIPNEEYRVKGEEKYGEVREIIKTSKDTIALDTRYADDRSLYIDLDEIMGEDVWVRNITYRGHRRDTIGTLELDSKWVQAYIYDLTLDYASDDDEISISIGRAEPTVGDNLKKKLKGRGIKSDFIQVSGENFKIGRVKLYIPYRESDGRYLKVLRYDEKTRLFEDVDFTVNKIDSIVEVESNNPGIFVVVE